MKELAAIVGAVIVGFLVFTIAKFLLGFVTPGVLDWLAWILAVVAGIIAGFKTYKWVVVQSWYSRW